MSLGHFPAEEGMEVELDASMDRVISYLHREVPKFSYDEYGYWLSPVKGVLGRSWSFLIKPYVPATDTMPEGSLGLLKAGRRWKAARSALAYRLGQSGRPWGKTPSGVARSSSRASSSRC